MNDDDPFGDLVPKTLAFPISSPSQSAQSSASVADVSFDDLIPQQPMPGVWGATQAGVLSAIHGLGQTAETMRGGRPKAEQASRAAEPLAWSDVASPAGQLAPKIAYRLAEGAPAMVGGIAGGMAGAGLGTLAAPGPGTVVGAVAGGSVGTATISAAQTLGPYFAQALQENPDHPEKAYDQALRQATIAGVFGGASWAMFPLKAFQGPVKQLMFQAFGVQPGVAVAHKATSNVLEGKPVAEDLGQAYAEGAVMTALPMVGHAVVNKAVGAFKPGIVVPAVEDRVEPQFSSAGFGSREVQPVVEPGAVIEPAEPVAVKKPRGRKTAADLVAEPDVVPQAPAVDVPAPHVAAGSASPRTRDGISEATRAFQERLSREKARRLTNPVAEPDVPQAPAVDVPAPHVAAGFDFDSVPRSEDRRAALRKEADEAEPDSWHQRALQEALNTGINPEIAKSAVQWASGHDRPDIIRMIVGKADAQAEIAEKNKALHPELDYWARRSKQLAEDLRNANTGDWSAPAPQEALALGHRPLDILGFIRSMGGIKDTDGDLKAMGGRERTGIINNKSGMHPDRMRERLVEEGYLSDAPSDQQTQSTVNDLYSAVDDALRGRKIYRATDEERATQIDRVRNKSLDDEQAEHAIMSQVRKHHRENDLPYGLTPEDETDIVQRVMRGSTVEDALERQATEWYNEVYDGGNEGSTLAGGARPLEGGQGRKGFEAEGDTLEASADRFASGEQAPFSFERQGSPTLDVDPNAGAARVRAAIERAMPKLPAGTKVTGVRDMSEAPGAIGSHAAELQDATGRRMLGSIDADTGDIYIAHHAMDPDATVGHELVHALRLKGLINDGDLKLMVDKANATPGLWDRKLYENAYADRNNRDELLAQEAAAHLYEARIAGRDFGTRINVILDAVRNFLERVRNGLTGQGFRTAGDVMDAIDSGRLAGRRPNYPSGRRPDLAYSMGDERKPVKRTPAYEQRAQKILEAVQEGQHTSDIANALDINTQHVNRFIRELVQDGRLEPADVARRSGSPKLIRFSPEEEQWVADNYHKMGRQEIIERLGYSEKVYGRQLPDILSRHGVEPKVNGQGGGVDQRTPSAIAARNARMIEDARSGMSINEIAKKNGVKYTSAKDVVVPEIEAGAIADVRLTKARDPKLIQFIQEYRADGISMGDIAKAWNEEHPHNPITRNVVAGIRRDHADVMYSMGDVEPLEIRPMSKVDLHEIAQATYSTPYTIEAVKRVPISSLTGGHLTPEKVAPLTDAIKRNQWIEPLVVDGDGSVIEGQHRLRALAKLGVKDVPVYEIRELLTDSAAKAMKQAAESAGVRREHATQIVDQIAKIIDSEGIGELPVYEPPRGYEKAWDAVVSEAQKQDAANALQRPRAPSHELDDSLNQNSQSDSPNLLHSFGGERAKTADHEALALAKKMDGKGEDRSAIWHQTGWFKGVDGKWRFEIDDSGAGYWPDVVENTIHDNAKWTHDLIRMQGGIPGDAPTLDAVRKQGVYGRLDDVLDHNELYGAYPHMRETPWASIPPHKMASPGANGVWLGAHRGMEVSNQNYAGKSTTLHETAHGIQDVENTARGGNPRMFSPDEIIRERTRLLASEPEDNGWTSIGNAHPDMSDSEIANGLYRRIAGEVEARTVQKRMNLSPEERRARPPWMDYDVPEDQQIVRFGGSGASMSEDGRKYPLAPRDEWYGEANYETNGGVMRWMSPDDYLKQVRPLKIDDVSRDNIDDLKQHIQSGRTLDPLQIYKGGKEDGRHRAVAAKELGIDQVPVIVFEPSMRKLGSSRPKSSGGRVETKPLPVSNTPVNKDRAITRALSWVQRTK